MAISARSIGVGVLAMLALATLVLAVLLLFVAPRLIGGESFQRAASAAVGGEVRYSRLELAYFPPTIVLEEPSLVRGAVRARADRAVVNLSLAPLLARVVWIDSVTVERASFSLVRSDAGWDGITFAQGDTAKTDPRPEVRTDAAENPLRFALREIVLSDASFVIEDRTLVPPLRWDVAAANGRIAVAPQSATLEIAGEVSSGGNLVVNAKTTAGGEIDAEIRLVDVDLAAATPYFAPGTRLAGAVGGTIQLAGPRIQIDLELREGRLKLGDIALRGPVAVSGRIDREKRPTLGRLDVDATASELQYADFFTKPPGTRATVRGLVTEGADGAPEIRAWKFEMENFEGRASVR